MTWLAPMRLRILPCDWLMALAQICGTLRSTRLAVMSTLASIELPTATTAIWKSSAPIWRSASIDRASACTAWVTRSDHFCTSVMSSSTASTSRLRRCSWPAVAAPKRPRPITSTGASWAIFSTNDGPLLGAAEELPPDGCRERRGESHCTDAAEEHGGGQDVLRRLARALREAGGEPARGEGADHVEQHVVERRILVDEHDEDRRPGHDGRAPEHHRHRQAQHIRRHASAVGLHVVVAARLGEGGEEQDGEGRHLDAARGRGGATADEHEHVGHEQARAVELVDVDRREAAGSRHDREEEAVQDAVARIHVAHRVGVAPFEPEVGECAAYDERPEPDEGELDVQRPAVR